MKTILLLTTALMIVSCKKKEIAPVKEHRIVMLGDSETRRINHYWGADTNWNTILGIDSVFNYGFDAYNSGDILGGPLQQALEKHPTKLFLMIGINDVHHNVPLATTLQNISAIIDIAKDSTEIIVQSVLPTTNYYDTLYGGQPVNGVYASRAKILNDNIISLCASKGVKFIDLRPNLTYTSGSTVYLRNDCSIDGIHLNFNGYLIWAEYLKLKIQ